MGDIVRKVGKDGRFLGWYIRFVDSDGRRKQRASHKETRSEAKRLLLQVEARVAQGHEGLPKEACTELSVAALFARFLTEFFSPRIKDMRRYRYAAELNSRQLLALIGTQPAAELSRRELEQARDELLRRYKANTIRSFFRPLGAVYSWAVRRDIVNRNPVRGLELPRPERSLEHLAQCDALALLKAAQELVDGTASPAKRLLWRSRQMALTIALRLGLRRGEVFGLRWQDLDLIGRRATIARSYRGATKSSKPRYLPLPADLAEKLAEWKRECPETSDDVVCPARYRSRWGMLSLSRDGGLRKMVATAGLRRLVRGWHSLRHSFAGMYISSGGSLFALQTILGHASPATTQIYAHLSPDYLAAEMERVKL